MRNPESTRVGSWLRHVMAHIQGAARRKLAPGEAVDAISEDTRRFLRSLRKPAGSHDHRKAVRKVKEGVDAYNNACYEDAERAFRKALQYDDRYGRAHYFLGNTCYKLGHLTEAATHWNKVIACEPFSDLAEQAGAKITRLCKTTTDTLLNGTNNMR
ncbi:MAG: tetratricopeptide repeat protein [Candidatus Hydrogenedentes bacterium]|nr:tetratricopeptide repeat protein [Candidatus Hydrogenedentota bacterium]